MLCSELLEVESGRNQKLEDAHVIFNRYILFLGIILVDAEDKIHREKNSLTTDIRQTHIDFQFSSKFFFVRNDIQSYVQIQKLNHILLKQNTKAGENKKIEH